MTSSTLEFEPTQGELSVVAAILGYARSHFGTSSNLDGGFQIASDNVVEILQRSGLPTEDLAGIWSIADEDGDGNLSERELAIAVRLMGWAQSGKPVNRSFLNYSNGPLPNLRDVWDNKWNSGQEPVQLPPVSRLDKIEFNRSFREGGPVNGLLDGEKVRDIYLKTNLSFNDLDRIWNLVDTEQRGCLNSTEFAIGMYLIQGVKTCQITTLPTSIPAQLYDQFAIKSQSPFIAPKPPPKSAPLPWKSPSLSVKTGITSPIRANNEEWDVSATEQDEAFGHFDTLDVDKKGLIDGDESARFMLKLFQLSPNDVAEIWDLVDLRRDNQLNKEQLAVAVHLIHRKLDGIDLPIVELPRTLIPPSMRPKPQNHIRRASAPGLPPKRPPPPIPPPSRKPSLSMSSSSTPTLKRATSFSPTTPATPRPQKSFKPELGNRFSIATIAEAHFTPNFMPGSRSVPQSPYVSTTPQDSLSPPRVPPVPRSPNPQLANRPPLSPNPPDTSPPSLVRSNSIDQQTINELRTETKSLRGNVEELMNQLKKQNQYRDLNDTLKEDNERLKKRLQEMDQTINQIIQANEGADRTDELTQEVARLTNLLTQSEHTEADLRDTLHSVSVLTQENNQLKQRYEDLKVEKGSLEKELADVGLQMQNLQGEKNSVTTRLAEMEKLLADPQKQGSSRKELQLLLKDVTKENELLKSREREMQEQMSTILLTSRNQSLVDDLKRENSRLKRQVEELDEVVRGMQASSSDNVLKRRINELEREKQALNNQIGEMTRRVAGVEELSGRRIEELERQCRELVAMSRTPGHQQIMETNHDENAPPPAYEEVPRPTFG